MDIKSRIEIVTNLIKTTAVVVGIVFGLYEFVWKDREQERQQITLTLDQVNRGRREDVVAAQKRLQSLHDLAYKTPVDDNDMAMRMDVSQRFVQETMELAHFYAVLQRCIEYEYCKAALVRALVCEDARRDWDLIDELLSRVGDRFVSHRPRFEPLAAFRNSCGAYEPYKPIGQ